MKYIRKKINLENFTIRSIPKSVLIKNSEGKTVIDESNPKYYYGTIPEFKIDKEGNFKLNSFGQKIPNTIDVSLFITQKIDDMGIFTDNPYTPKTETLTTKPQGFNSFTYGRLAGAPVEFYYKDNINISGYTDDSLLSQVKNKYTKKVDEFGKNTSYKTTIFETGNGGWDEFNTSLSATTKKEEYLGVVFKPEVDSVVFINRGIADIFERHALLSEIKTTNDIDTNRGGFIRI
jgi:hypothetical protein